MATQPESRVVNAIKKYVTTNGGFVVKQHGTAFSMKGCPDLLICFKGRFLGIECKIGKNQPSKIQLFKIEEIKRSGGVAGVVWSLEDFIEILKENNLYE